MAEPVRVARLQGRGRRRGAAAPSPTPVVSVRVVHLGPPGDRCSPAAVDVAPGPPSGSARPANMHARGRRHSDRRTASTPAMAAAAAKNIAKRSASYAQANPRLNKETNAIMVSLPYVGVQSVPSTLPRAQVSLELNEPRGAKCGPTNCRRRAASTLSARSISQRQIKVIADEVRSFLPYLGQTRNDAPSAL